MIPEDKFDLIIEILRQQDKRFDQFEKRFEQKFEQVDKRFEQSEKRFEQKFEQMYRRFDELKEKMKDVRYDLRLNKEKLGRVYEARNQVTVSFSRSFATINACIAGAIAVFVSLFMSK